MLKKIADFLPPPELLFAREETKEITISLSKKSIDFFKNVSKENNIPYQQMIRKIFDNYSEYYSQ
ncbi:MAG: CopG family transcriptional regulator [Spirochaetia bacterium]|nr:CopG family transcriptional regulator [Spirochaetia bacterium]